MRFLLVLAVLAAIFTTVHAQWRGCEEAWGDRRIALNDAYQVCKDDSLNGTYGPSSATSGSKAICLDYNDMRFEFQIWHIQSGNRELQPNECYNGLYAEIIGCGHGADTTLYETWKFE
jgi:hypothetical protein